MLNIEVTRHSAQRGVVRGLSVTDLDERGGKRVQQAPDWTFSVS